MKRGTDMNVDFYEYDNLGFAVDPESDTKEITVILVGKQTVKANPRPAVIYVTGGAIDKSYAKLEELKKYCAENKVVFLCPKATEVEELAKTYHYAVSNFKKLNIVPDQISVKSDENNKEPAEELVDYVLDEYDAELDPVETFSV